jgi:hypothetical protein
MVYRSVNYRTMASWLAWIVLVMQCEMCESQEKSIQRWESVEIVSRLHDPWNAPVVSGVKFRAAEIKPPYVYGLQRDGDLYVFKIPDDTLNAFWSGAFSLPNSMLGFEDDHSLIESASQLEFIGTLKHAGDGRDLIIVGDSLLLSNQGGLEVYSIADPSLPEIAVSIKAPKSFSTNALVLSNTELFVLGDRTICSYDIEDPLSPKGPVVSNNKRSNFSGCSDGRNLIVAETKTAGVGSRQGIAVYEGSNAQKLKEVSFCATAKVPYHLFVDSDSHLLACGDSGNWFHSWSTGDIKVDGLTATFQVLENGQLGKVGEIKACGGRAVTAIHDKSKDFLICNGAVMDNQWKSLNPIQSFSPWGTTLDGAPYHGANQGNYAVLATDSDLAVFRIRASKQRFLGRVTAMFLIRLAFQYFF